MTEHKITPGAIPEAVPDIFSELMDNLNDTLSEMETSAQAVIEQGAEAEFAYMVNADAANLTARSIQATEARIANLLAMSDNPIFSQSMRRNAARKALAMMGFSPSGVSNA